MYERLRTQLKRDEALRLSLYEDTTKHLTIGYGRNIQERGITEYEAEVMLSTDIDIATVDALTWIGGHDYWVGLGEVRQSVLIQMLFNMGSVVMRSFKRFKAALHDRNWDVAAFEMLDSVWAKQVGQRAIRLANEMKTGVYCD